MHVYHVDNGACLSILAVNVVHISNVSRSVEVLKIIAKVLAFDDEQLIAVGLKVPNIDIFATILSTVIGKPAPPPELEVSTPNYFIWITCAASTRNN